MMEFSLWKKLRKRLRRKRRPLWMLGSIVIGLFIASLLFVPAALIGANAPKQSDYSVLLQKLESQKEPFSVKLHSVYVCGDEVKPLGRMMSKEIMELINAHPEWTPILDQQQSMVLFEQHVEDMSDHCKENAYMGVDKDGNLTLYDGVPKKEKVVKTFFQLDVRYMESSLPQDKLDELAGGIRISDIEEYNSVLSTYSDFAIEHNEKVMKPAY